MRQILRSAKLPRDNAEIVLCHLAHNSITPYVTWQMNTQDGDCYWGHYFPTYREAEDDFKDRAVRLHAKIRKPFNVDVHANLIAEGFMMTQHESDFEDIGDGESGPCLTGGPAWDEYENPTHRIAIDHHGMVDMCEERDIEQETYEALMAV